MIKTSISVVMVSWHTGPVLFRAIDACRVAEDVDEIILVDHENPDITRAKLDQLAREGVIQLVRTDKNLGFAKGCNIGAKAASRDVLLFLNPDTVIAPDAPRRMALSLLNAETAASPGTPILIGGRILHMNGQEQRGGRRGELTPWSATVGFFGLHRLAFIHPIFKDIHKEFEPLPSGPADIPVVSGAVMMMSKGGYRAVQGFDERYFLHVEDIDICRRVREAGGRVIFEPRALVPHHGSTSDVGRYVVEHHKAKGLVKYFWRFYPALWQRALTLLAAPGIYTAMMVRLTVLKMIVAFRGD
ncbi:glycosyltransferase [Woodsholea maritima]|uniref:glycosyltransferase n=1 Tax=Woodsholea maritima TaxID=240237 RepID=UPI00037EAFCB|nr:glycosyltransferase family 2 protein [Woodsholea maritima]